MVDFDLMPSPDDMPKRYRKGCWIAVILFWVFLFAVVAWIMLASS